MHVHACNNGLMRTTIEMKPEHRARVLELAANRGDKGFSGVVAEALEFYLEAQSGRTDAIRKALALRGSMREAEAAGLLSRTCKIRADWRSLSPISMSSIIWRVRAKPRQ
jgi:predicted transcriptional regulator